MESPQKDKSKHDSYTRSETTTTFIGNAGYSIYRCGFFCQRRSNKDVCDQKENVVEAGATENLTIEKVKT